MPQIASLDELRPERFDTVPILRQLAAANRQLAELKGIAGSIPHQGILINTLGMQEAKDSSEIENIVTTTDRLFQFAHLAENRADPATKEVLRYRTALRAGFEWIRERPLNTRLAVELGRTIKDTHLDIRAVPGTVLASDQTGAAIYTPPKAKAGCVIYWPIGNGSFTRPKTWTPWYAWPSATTNSRPSIRSPMAMGEPVGSSTSSS